MRVICACVVGDMMMMMTRIFISIAHISLVQDFPLPINHLHHMLWEM